MFTCVCCKIEKSESEFYAQPSAARGHDSSCKDCRKAKVSANRLEKVEYYREYDRNRGSRQDYEYLKAYREEFPNKYKAHNKVNNALRDGKIFKPECCEQCGSDFAVVAHHNDYLKQLEVNWLCEVCHKAWHSINGEALNAT